MIDPLILHLVMILADIEEIVIGERAITEDHIEIEEAVEIEVIVLAVVVEVPEEEEEAQVIVLIVIGMVLK